MYMYGLPSLSQTIVTDQWEYGSMGVWAGEGGLSVGRGGLSVGYALYSIYPYPWEEDLSTTTTTTTMIMKIIMIIGMVMII